MRYQLSAADRERLGLPEWVEYDRLSVKDGEALEAAGANWNRWLPTSIYGLRMAVWLTLHKEGKAPEKFDDIDFDLIDVRAESPGKAPSAKSGARTRTTSAASSRSSTSRRKA